MSLSPEIKTLIDRLREKPMKQLPDEETMWQLLKLASDAERKSKDLCDLTAKIDEKWRIRLESRQEVFKQSDRSEKIS